MQSKGFIKLIAVLLALACVYQLSFTFKTRGVEKQAAAYAAQFPLDQQGEAEQHYLDSVQNLPVYNLGFRKFTYKECKEKELNLGLDLKGGMNVMLEVQVEDVVKALAGDSQNDPAFIEAIGVANEAMKQGSSTDYISDFVKAYSRLSNGRPIAELFVSPDRKDITLESSDADVEKILKKETEAAIGASFNVLRSRIDHFGVTQPNILRLPNSHRILVELPGVKEPQRVRDLLQGTASLEFWTTYDANEIFPALSAADKLIKAELAQAPAAAPETAAAGTPAAEAEGLIAEVGAADSTATAALAFNALLIIGIFSMFYGLLPFNLEVNQAFIAAILTIIGYAINDTVVVFDRIREYLGLYPKRNLKETVNNAINSTLSRTINTSGTTLVTLLAIFFFGGETIRGFIFALIIGVVVGTAATIFLATPIAYDLMTKRAKTDVEK